jgi:alkanesulfonate monooxygenase SsuD/methylene tetrahydromethanopterin reductase-like flavin-dependent oxidoreductase (luciferase family)
MTDNTPDGAGRPLRVGVQLPTVDGFGIGFGDFVPAARLAEELGFDSVWVGDHLSFRAPVVESFVALATAAAVTSRVGLGTGVLIPPLRQPVWTAKQISSLQAVSADRLVLGVGVGGEFAAEWDAAGVPRSERGQRMDSFLAALPAMLSGREVELGAPWHAKIPPLTPFGALPPVWVGGRKDVALRRAARFGAGWLGVWHDVASLTARKERLHAMAAETGVPVPPMALQVLVHPTPAADQGDAEMGIFMEQIYGIPYGQVQRFCVGGDEEALVERLGALVEVGLDTIVLIPAVRNQVDELPGLGRVAEALRVKGAVRA